MSEADDIELASAPRGALGSDGRNVISVIGIDRYHHWQGLTNAVRDATGTLALFQQLGFEQVTAPLLDDRATGNAIQSLVTDDLMTLRPDDSLVLFYAGHGGTRRHRLGDHVVKTGYLIPIEASDSHDKVATWIDLEGWLRAVSLLPAKHILVLLDACHSGIALDPIIKWRDVGAVQDVSLSTLNARRSRRIITSALDDQVALDSGPVYGHSLFTGCLIEGLTRGIQRGGSRITTGSELGLYLQRRVGAYPNSRQTPDFGTFAFDDRGEMVIPLVSERPDELAMRAEPALAGPTPSSPATTITTVATIAPTPEPTTEPVPHRPDRGRRWVILGVVGAALALIEYRRLTDASRDAAANRRPDGPLLGDIAPPAGPQPRTCPDGMMRVAAGTFWMGSPDGAGDADEHPQHSVTLSAYCIDKTEVTVKAYAACVAASGCFAAPLTVSWSGYSADDVRLYSRLCNRHDRPEHPINCIDWNQATAYCTWVGNRLPTEAEWEYAARGNDGRSYPWGNEAPSATRLNACGTECVAAAKRVLDQDWSNAKLYDAHDGWATSAPVGSFPAGASPFGVLDMAGNVWEWTADWYGDYASAMATNPSGAKTGLLRVNRGGGWRNDGAGLVRSAYRGWLGPTERSFYVGFRCARGD